jgi:hypothetical protein
MRRPVRSFGPTAMTRQQGMTQFIQFLATAAPEKVLALTIEEACRRHSMDRRLAEVKLLAAQDKIRRSSNG